MPASTSTRMISSGPYADELMLSLEKIARPLTFVSRSCSSRSLWIGRPIRAVRAGAAPASSQADRGPCARWRSAPPSSSPRLEGVLERPHDADIGVAGALAAAFLTDFEQGIDPVVVGRLWDPAVGRRRRNGSGRAGGLTGAAPIPRAARAQVRQRDPAGAIQVATTISPCRRSNPTEVARSASSADVQKHEHALASGLARPGQDVGSARRTIDRWSRRQRRRCRVAQRSACGRATAATQDLPPVSATFRAAGRPVGATGSRSVKPPAARRPTASASGRHRGRHGRRAGRAASGLGVDHSDLLAGVQDRDAAQHEEQEGRGSSSIGTPSRGVAWLVVVAEGVGRRSRRGDGGPRSARSPASGHGAAMGRGAARS